MSNLKEQLKTQAGLYYVYGGKYNRSRFLNVYVNDGKLFYGKHSIKLSEIQRVSMKQEEQVTEHMKSRLTATRLLLLGPFALAAPKRSFVTHATTTKYLVVDYIEEGVIGSIVFKGSNCNKMMNTIRTYLLNISKESIVSNHSEQQQINSDPYIEVKRMKELLDMNIITQEEFDQKKKELLPL